MPVYKLSSLLFKNSGSSFHNFCYHNVNILCINTLASFCSVWGMEFSKYLVREIQISKLWWKGRSSSSYSHFASHEAAGFAGRWVRKKCPHPSRQRAVVTLLRITLLFATEPKSSLKKKTKKQKKKVKPYCKPVSSWTPFPAQNFKWWACHDQAGDATANLISVIPLLKGELALLGFFLQE